MKRFTGTLLALSCLAQPLMASAEGVDKSGYSILNPTPENEMRDFFTDRPNRCEGPFTVDAGHFQYESSIAAYSRHRTIVDGVDTTAHSATANDMTLRLGLLNNLDIETEIPSYSWQSTRIAGGASAALQGFGDVNVHAKWNFLGNDGGPVALAIIPYVKAPTATGGLGNGKVEGGFFLPVALNLPNSFLLQFSFETARLKNADDNRFHTDFNTVISLTHPLMKDLSGYAEFYAGARGDGAAGWESSFDLGLEYMLRKNIQLDGGCNFGLNSLANDFSTFLGLSFRL